MSQTATASGRGDCSGAAAVHSASLRIHRRGEKETLVLRPTPSQAKNMQTPSLLIHQPTSLPRRTSSWTRMAQGSPARTRYPYLDTEHLTQIISDSLSHFECEIVDYAHRTHVAVENASALLVLSGICFVSTCHSKQHYAPAERG